MSIRFRWPVLPGTKTPTAEELHRLVGSSTRFDGSPAVIVDAALLHTPDGDAIDFEVETVAQAMTRSVEELLSQASEDAVYAVAHTLYAGSADADAYVPSAVETFLARRFLEDLAGRGWEIRRKEEGT